MDDGPECAEWEQDTDLEAQVDVGYRSQPETGAGEERSHSLGLPRDASPQPLFERVRSRSQGSTYTQNDADAGFAFIDGSPNETKVDMICVPCPGASPLDTWNRPFMDSLAKLPYEHEVAKHASFDEVAVSINRYVPPVPPVSEAWVRQGIRRKVPTARVLLYKHRALSSGVTLNILASDLLHYIQLHREANVGPSRPLFFVAHSVGGLVVKLALLQANETRHHRGILHDCHGISFFATPHRGSSYLARKHLRRTVGNLLQLHRPLPQSLAEELHLGNKKLLDMHERFVDLSSEMRVWTFYETRDSPLSGRETGLGGSAVGEVRFSAPLVSIKSSLLQVRHEQVFSVESDHAHCASFGPKNETTMAIYLSDLHRSVAKTTYLNEKYRHTPLNLSSAVNVETIGFFEDPDQEMDAPAAIRLYRTRNPLSQFLRKGPEKCLEERLTKGMGKKGSQHGQGPSQHKAADQHQHGGGSRFSGLGIWTSLRKMVTVPPESGNGATTSVTSPTSPASDVEPSPDATMSTMSPDIVVTLPSARPDSPAASRFALDEAQESLTVPAVSNPAFRRSSSRGSDGSTVSEPTHKLSRVISADSTTRGRANTTIPGPVSMADEQARRQASLSLAELGEWRVGFSRPDPDLKRFTWMHVPFTNPLWVKDVFEMLTETYGFNFSRLFNHESWVSRHVPERHSPYQPSFVKPSCQYFGPEAAPSSRASPGNSRRSSPGFVPSYMYLYLPYLHFDTYSNMIRRRKLINRRISHARIRPVPEDVAELESLELRMIWQYAGLDSPLNDRRTLDQFGYPSLRDTYARDDDQMLYKLTKEPRAPASEMPESRPANDGAAGDNVSDLGIEEELRDGKVIMVDQLWLWTIDKSTLTTFFPKRESSPLEGSLFQQADLWNSVYDELNGDLTGRVETAWDLAAFTAKRAVTVLLDHASHPDLEIFRIFQEALGILSERMTWNLKRFRMQTFRDGSDHDDDSQVSIKQRYKRELEKAERENRENTSAVLELRDMEDELTTLLKLFEAQDATLKTMKTIYARHDLADVTRNGQVYLDEALARIDEYKQQCVEMLKRVDTTRKDYEKLLEMAQRQAQVDDVRWSRLHAELAASQNLSVMIFTIFTVTFLPLSFFTSLFGIDTSTKTFTDLPLGTIGAIALPTSAFLVMVTLAGAFSARVQAAGKWVFGRAARGAKVLGDFVAALEPPARRELRAGRRDRAERERVRDAARRRQNEAYDLWALLKKQRGPRHEIPELNRGLRLASEEVK